MNKHDIFGALSAGDLDIGDIVEWSTWDPDIEDWDSNYGIITEIKNEIKGNRLISISVVVPVNGPVTEMEFFTPSLRLISRGNASID